MDTNIDTALIDIAPYIDHALLDPMVSQANVEQWCMEADRYHFHCVCVAPVHVREAVELLHGKRVQVAAVIGFPMGATTPGTKLFESCEAVDNGATELDVVINQGWLKEGNYNLIHQEIAEICQETGQIVKAILEVNRFNDEEKRWAAEACMDAGVQFLKTGTGWYGGVTIEDVRFLKQITKDRVGIKAAGGIRTPEFAIDLIAAGATRLGTSHGPFLIQHMHQRVGADKSLSSHRDTPSVTVADLGSLGDNH